LAAKVVATDHLRMLTLLKIEATGLPVAQAAPKADIKVGHTAIALGRTLAQNVQLPPSISVGIISAINRIWDKALQTDAKISPTNYGGPIVDLQGRVQGILVAASPRDGEDATAGVEWYDSGIGFAIPLEDVMAILPRLKKGKDLKKGLIGIAMKNARDIYSGAPTVESTSPDSAASRAGVKPGDIIKEIDKHPVANQAQLKHQLGTKYEGDTVSLKLQRDKEEVAIDNIVLAGSVSTLRQPFLGILAMRDDPDTGVLVRYVYEKSPAEAAGLKAGERIVKMAAAKKALQTVAGRDQMMTVVNTLAPGSEVKLEVLDKDKKDRTVTVRLGEMPDDVPDQLPDQASLRKGKPAAAQPKEEAKKEEGDKKDEDKSKPETGLLNRTNAAQDHEYWVYVPQSYDPNIAHGLVLWLHPIGKNKSENIKDFVNTWRIFCEDNNLILVGPKAENETGWIPSEADFIQEALQKVISDYTIDKRRVIAHGMGNGGQMALYLGFQNRELIRGVAVSGAVLPHQPKEKVGGQPLSFFITWADKDPLAKSIKDTVDKLREMKYPVVEEQWTADLAGQYMTDSIFGKLIRWIDSLDVI
jgi:S1-C subfamily serine protease